jgi:putative hemolysin
MHFIPDMLLYRTTGRWLLPLIPIVRVAMFVAWPARIFLEGTESLARISEKEFDRTPEQRTEEGIEALVEQAEEEGIIEPEQASLIEQVVEFSDKRVREVMTPRPDIVAISADSTLEELHTKVIETRFARLPVFERTLDDIFGVANAQDLLHIADSDLPKRKVRELSRTALFVPETKVGSELLREMRHKDQPMAIIIDEHGLVTGLATVEDLVEEIVGESGRNGANPAPDVMREPDGSLILRGSMGIGDVEELLNVQFGEKSDEAVTTIAGLLSHVLGKVPAPGDAIDLEDHRFEVLEANQRKVLRLRVRKRATPTPAQASAD